MSCQYAGYPAVDLCIPNEELESLAKVFPKMCKLMLNRQKNQYFWVLRSGTNSTGRMWYRLKR